MDNSHKWAGGGLDHLNAEDLLRFGDAMLVSYQLGNLYPLRTEQIIIVINILLHRVNNRLLILHTVINTKHGIKGSKNKVIYAQEVNSSWCLVIHKVHPTNKLKLL